MSFSFRTPFLDDDGFVSATWQRMLNALFSGSFSDSETPTGVINGANKVFTLAKTPDPSLCLEIFKNGILQIQGVDYALLKNVITFGAAPAALSTLKAFYRY